MAFYDAGSTPPPAGVPSGGGSTNLLNNYINQVGGAAGAISGAANSQDPYVYLGTKKQPATGTLPGSPESKSASQFWTTGRPMSAVLNQFMNSGNDNIHHWAYLLALTGYATAEAAMDPSKAADVAKFASQQDVFSMYGNFLKDAAAQFNIYHNKITPTQLLKQMLAYRLGDKWDGKLDSLTPENANKLLAGQGDQSKTTTQTSRSVDLMSTEDAKGLVRNMLQQELGRDPTQAEYEDFVATLHSAQKANPSITTATTTTDAQGNSSASYHSSGGLDSAGMQQALYEHLQDKPSYATWQAVGTYAPALFEALGATV